MPLHTRVTVYPDLPVQEGSERGGFATDSYRDLLGCEVTMPGLDPQWTHTVIGADVAPDRNSAELVFHSAPKAPKSLDRALRIVTWLPPAHIKAHDRDGTELAVTKLDAPLQLGQYVEVAGQRHRVAEVTWPHRDPDSGTCHEGLDYQHVTLVEDPEPAHEPTAVERG